MSDFLATLLAATMAEDLFSEPEAKALLRSIRATTPDEMPAATMSVVAWAQGIRRQQAMLDVIITLGADGAVEVRPSPDGTIEMQLTTSPGPRP